MPVLSFLFSGQKWTQSGHIFVSPLRLTPWFWKGYFQKQSTSLLSGRSTNTELAHPVLSTTPCARSVRPNVDIWARVLCRGGQAPSLLFLEPHFETSSFSVYFKQYTHAKQNRLCILLHYQTNPHDLQSTPVFLWSQWNSLSAVCSNSKSCNKGPKHYRWLLNTLLLTYSISWPTVRECTDLNETGQYIILTNIFQMS